MSPNGGAWYGTGKGKVVILLLVGGGIFEASGRRAIGQYVVGRLDVERFFDFGVGCYEEVDEDN